MELIPIGNLRGLFFFASGFVDFAFLLFLLNWILRLILHNDR